MRKRNRVTLSILAALVLPLGAGATDYRETNPKTWTAHTVTDAVQALYGDAKLIESSDITLKAPTVVPGGGSIPISVKSKIDAKSVSIFQDANPESAVAVFGVAEGGIVNYSMKIKLKKTAKVMVVVEGRDGNYYTAARSIEVTQGGCE